jgi:arylsulfatase A-like enzyme
LEYKSNTCAIDNSDSNGSGQTGEVVKSRREFLQQGGMASAGAVLTGLGTSSIPAAAQSSDSHSRPNIIFILADDMGFSDIGCYGSEVETPNLNSLAEGGLRFSSFYNNPRCCPSRASLLTGLYSHQVGFALMADNYGESTYPAYKGDLSENCVTIAEALRTGGYRTAMAGKWHLTPPLIESKHNWPMQRGFDRFFGTIAGACSYYDPATLTDGNERVHAGKDFYYTDAIGDHAVQYIDEFTRAGEQKPFFLYSAFTAPHWPLQAPENVVKKYTERFSVGWDQIRADRHRRQIEAGLLPAKWQISERDIRVPPWQLAADKEWEIRRMAVYAAQIECLDQNVGKIISKLKEKGAFENTLILFMSDNGGNLEELADTGPLGRSPIFMPHETADGRLVHPGNTPDISPGGPDTYQSIGIPWGNVTNTPFRMYKHYTQEGGISTPFIAHWPAGIKLGRNAITHQIGHETDVMATLLDLAQTNYPKQHAGHTVLPTVGTTLVPVFSGKARAERNYFWEHEGNAAVRMGKWKLVSAFPDYWQLYDMDADRTELHDLADQNLDRVRQMTAAYKDWAKMVGAEPWPVQGIAPTVPGVMPYLRKENQLD